ncbi:MAG: Bug family tripartite tricarboxylate transporter substrate binding protein [Lautropia sp.]
MLRFFRVLLFVSAALSAAIGTAAEFPTRTIRIVVPFAPGGPADTVNRLVAAELARVLSTTVIVENKPGAGSVAAAQYVLNAPADGYTLLVVTNTFTMPAAFDKLPYDTLRDFRPIGNVISQPNVLVANAAFPPNTVPELVAYAKREKTPVMFATTSQGSPLTLSIELFGRAAGFPTVQVPYAGSAPAQFAVVGGQVPLMFDGWYFSRQQVNAGKLKIIAAFGERRMKELPDVPTVAEFYPGLSSNSIQGLVVRREVPDDVVGALAAAVEKVVKSPAFAEKTVGNLGNPEWMNPTEFGAFLESETKKWSDASKAAKFKAN